MRKMPLGMQSFRKIVEGEYIYVDKTQYVYDLINSVSHYFLSRPRRFGKSLLLDTVSEVFSGDKELFKGLYIYDSDYCFEKHPVIRLDMSNIANKTPEALEESISQVLKERAYEDELNLLGNTTPDLFRQLIKALHKKYNKKVVVLIDEYDKPILDHLIDLETADANRQVIKSFYGILKSMDPFLRFTFITGVSKFTKTSLFSELNNLLDITMTKRYSNICGIEVEDLKKYFGEHIKHFSTHEDFKRYDNIHDEILAWYDGYSWDGTTRLINPFSLLSFFLQNRFSGFWYSSGTPAFLIKLIKENPSSFLSLNKLEISERSLDTFDIHKMKIVPLMFQTGYLTVGERRFRGDSESYVLRMPNLEVKEAFYLSIIEEFTENEDNTEAAYWQIKDSLKTGDLDSILLVLKSLFASIPYQLHIRREAYYHSIFIALMNVLGFQCNAEVSTATGRIDAVLELDDKVYIVEFKYNDCPQDATPEEKAEMFKKALVEGIVQIKDKGYSKKYSTCGKKVYQAAFAFLGKDEIEMMVEIVD